jgi:hypothetical protein
MVAEGYDNPLRIVDPGRTIRAFGGVVIGARRVS